MKIRYSCRNNSIGGTSSKIFRLRNYSGRLEDYRQWIQDKEEKQ
ncbi:MAG: hypothetical protein U9R36_00985 [Elusimicrobiota bacterium]|nr:hypothetical protein [Elusimicrobiota bacterium]